LTQAITGKSLIIFVVARSIWELLLNLPQSQPGNDQ